ncbi:MAG TPA: hypothetical protein V6D26_19985 [Stenomitos sp.]
MAEGKRLTAQGFSILLCLTPFPPEDYLFLTAPAPSAPPASLASSASVFLEREGSNGLGDRDT